MQTAYSEPGHSTRLEKGISLISDFIKISVGGKGKRGGCLFFQFLLFLVFLVRLFAFLPNQLVDDLALHVGQPVAAAVVPGSPLGDGRERTHRAQRILCVLCVLCG